MHPSMQMQVYLCHGRASRLSRSKIVDISRRVFFDLDVGEDACLIDCTSSPMCIAEGETISQDEPRSIGANSNQTAKAMRSRFTIVHATLHAE